MPENICPARESDQEEGPFDAVEQDQDKNQHHWSREPDQDELMQIWYDRKLVLLWFREEGGAQEQANTTHEMIL